MKSFVVTDLEDNVIASVEDHGSVIKGICDEDYKVYVDGELCSKTTDLLDECLDKVISLLEEILESHNESD